jgi:hypothetical protein
MDIIKKTNKTNAAEDAGSGMQISLVTVQISMEAS